MSTEIKRDRSPNYPKLPLEQSVDLVRRLYKEIGKTKVRAQVAIGPLGYTGLNGASLTTLGALTAYGLIGRERGESVSVSPLAIRLIHPMNHAQGLESRREAAISPKIFSELFSGGYHAMAEDVLSNHLVQNGFTPDGAKKASSVFKANVLFAKLDEPGIIVQKHDDRPDATSEVAGMKSSASPAPLHSVLIDMIKRGEIWPGKANGQAEIPEKQVLAQYSVPLGSNEATLIITGQSLSTEHFDALGEYVELFKKQFQRRIGSTQTVPPIPAMPANAIWKTKDCDKPVKLIAFMGDRN